MNHPGHGGHGGSGHGAAGGEPGLRVVFWETTAACNLECAHCRRLDVSTELSKRDLTTQEGKSLIGQLVPLGRPLLVLSGGEPLIRPDIFDLAQHAYGKGLPVALATNGTMVDPERADQIAAAGIRRVSISLDGADADTHNRFRKIPGSFEQALQGIMHLKNVGVPVQINMTVAKHNAHQLEDLFILAERIGAIALHLFALVPVGCGVEIADDQMLSPEEIEEVLTEFYENSKHSRLETRATCAPQYSRIARQLKAAARRAGEPEGREPDPGRGCLAGGSVCFVSHEGKVFPCGYLPAEAGDLRAESFEAIWNRSEVFNRLRQRDLLTGKCGDCEFVQVCMGCRARAYSQTGDFMTEEPSCSYVPKRTSSAT